MALSPDCTFEFDIHLKQIISDCTNNPSEVSQHETYWLYAKNNKYSVYDSEDDNEKIDPEKIGKWMVFLPRTEIDSVWNKVKEAVKEGHLWETKVSTMNSSNSTHVLIVYTKDYTDKDDVIRVLDYLETSNIKPPNKIIHYKTDLQTANGVYSNKNTKASYYSSNTIRFKHGISGKQKTLTAFFSKSEK